MKSIEKLKKEHAASLARATVYRQIADQLPVEPDQVAQHVRSLPVMAYYKADGIAGALAIFRRFSSVVPFVFAKSTFGYIAPWELLQKRKENIGEDCIRFEPGAVALTVRQGEGFGPCVEFEFYSRLASGEVIEVEIKITGPDYIGNYSRLSAEFAENRDPSGRLLSVDRRPNTLAHSMADKTVAFAAGPSSERAADYRYLFTQNHAEDLAGEDCSHAVAQLAGLAHRLGEGINL